MTELNDKLEEITHINKNFAASPTDYLGYDFSFRGDFSVGEMKLIIDMLQDMDENGHVIWLVEKFIAYSSEKPVYDYKAIEAWSQEFIGGIMSKTACNTSPHGESEAERNGGKHKADSWHGFQFIECFFFGYTREGELEIEVKFSDFVREPLLKKRSEKPEMIPDE